MSVFTPLFLDKILVVKKDDSYTSKEIPAMAKPNEIHFHAEDLPEGFTVETGDYLDRILPNGNTDRYVILAPNLKDAFMTIPAIFEAKVRMH